MKFITSANRDFKRFWDVWKDKMHILGYDYAVYDIGGLGEGIEFTEKIPPKSKKVYTAKSPFKPKMLKDARKRFDGTLVYMDVDAYPLMRIDDINGDYDVGITVHPKRHRRENHVYKNAVGYLNAGVMVLNNADAFIDQWMETMKETEYGSDQEALTLLLSKYHNWSDKDTVMVGNSKVRLLDASIWNFTYFKDGITSNTKVVHYVGAWKSQFGGY